MRTRAPLAPKTAPTDIKMQLILVVVVGVIFVLLGIFVWRPMIDSSNSSLQAINQASQTELAVATVMSQAMKGTRGANSKFPQPVLTFGGTGTAPGLFQEARLIAVDGSGNIYVADAKTMRIQKFDAEGKYISQWIQNDAQADQRFSYIDALSADHAGRVYVTANGKIYKYDGATGKLLQTITGHNYLSAFPLAEGGLVATASSTTQDDVVRLDADGKQVWYKPAIIASQPEGKAPFRLRIAVDGLGTIFALQDQEGAVYKYTSGGQFVNKFGSKGGETGQFNADGIRLIAVDNASNVYVSDFGELYVFDATGRFVKMFDAFDGAGGAPRDMVVTDKNEVLIVQDDNKIYEFVYQ